MSKEETTKHESIGNNSGKESKVQEVNNYQQVSGENISDEKKLKENEIQIELAEVENHKNQENNNIQVKQSNKQINFVETEKENLNSNNLTKGFISYNSKRSIVMHNEELKRAKTSSNYTCCSKNDDIKDLPYEFFINQNEKNKIYEFKNNTVTQAKYTAITFFPLALIYQFVRLANVYFLIIAIIQLTEVSPLDPTMAVVPLLLVLLFSIIREGIEDLARHKNDEKLNSEPTLLYKDSQFLEEQSGKLEMGEIVLVKENENFPADLLLLDSSITNGVCFIETATLDGEKTPKNKIAHIATAGIYRKEDGSYRTDLNLQGVCTCEKPNSELYSFDGMISITYATKEGEKRIETGLDAKQLLLKGKYDNFNNFRRSAKKH